MFGFSADDYFGYLMYREYVGIAVFIIFVLIFTVYSAITEMKEWMKERFLKKNGFEHQDGFRKCWKKGNLIIDDREIKHMSYKNLKQRVIE